MLPVTGIDESVSTDLFNFYLGETVNRIARGSLVQSTLQNNTFSLFDNRDAVIVGTLLGSIILMTRIGKADFELLTALQQALSTHSTTRPLLGGNYYHYRYPKGWCPILDGDLLAEFLRMDRSSRLEFVQLTGLPGPDHSTLPDPNLANAYIDQLASSLLAIDSSIL